MKTRVWKTVALTTESEQVIEIFPNPEFDGIIFTVKELDGRNSKDGLYLGEEELNVFIEELKNMMEYIKINK